MTDPDRYVRIDDGVRAHIVAGPLHADQEEDAPYKTRCGKAARRHPFGEDCRRSVGLSVCRSCELRRE